MEILLLIVAMIFFHIIDDYYLQGWLASAKQKEWWEKNAPNPLYKNDYIMALIEHAFSWTCMIHIPLLIYIKLYCNADMRPFIIVSMALNWEIHAIVDDLKANQKKINLIQDQLVHIFQILSTVVLCIIINRMQQI